MFYMLYQYLVIFLIITVFLKLNIVKNTPGQVILSCCFQQGNTALHLAAAGNFSDLTQMLISTKAEIDLPNHVGPSYMY